MDCVLDGLVRGGWYGSWGKCRHRGKFEKAVSGFIFHFYTIVSIVSKISTQLKLSLAVREIGGELAGGISGPLIFFDHYASYLLPPVTLRKRFFSYPLGLSDRFTIVGDHRLDSPKQQSGWQAQILSLMTEQYKTFICTNKYNDGQLLRGNKVDDNRRLRNE